MTETEFRIKMSVNNKYFKQGHDALISAAWNGMKEDNQNEINQCFIWSAMVGHKDLMNFLLTDSDSKLHADIHFEKDSAFLDALIADDKEILKFLIIDMAIEKTKHIEEYLAKANNEKINAMFENRVVKNKSIKP